ncbi:alanine--glyoxylate aminotransferase 2, mitochondrial-like [Antedon mediterranea]|uniref:alanine--glyoxylate aminotransferase 2, mitochondrial-like n=1 Tax=Antedon mediterranea TaxID=105859 RepID=UPI003AF469B0
MLSIRKVLGEAGFARIPRYYGTAARNSKEVSSNGLPDMPPCDFEPAPYKGPSYEETRKIRNEKSALNVMTYYKKPVLINQGHMQWLFDETGRRYLDLFAGIVTVSVGHCHPKVNAVLKEQLDLLWHTTNIYMHPRVHEYAVKLTERLPEPLSVCFFVNSGSEANDLAMFMARAHTKSNDIIGLRSAYHGMISSLMGFTAMGNWMFPHVAKNAGIQTSVNADPFRGPWGGKNCRDSPVQTIRSCDCVAGQCLAKDMYVDQVNDLLQHCTPKKIAAVIAESIQGVAGGIQFPKGFLKEAFELARAKGGLCISDEVQTGFGRMGSHFWGFETHDVMPDIVVMAKGMGNGFPLAAVVTTPEIAQTMHQALHFNTFGGNPMSCAVGSAVLDVMDEEGSQANCADVGTYMLLELAKLRDEFEVVGDVRGKGLMIGVELVADKASRKPLQPEEVGHIWESTKDLGVLFGKGGLHGNVLRIKPPMCITRQDVDFGTAVLKRALEHHRDTYL